MTFNNYKYRSDAESHKRLQKLVIGDEVLIRVHSERFPLGTLKKALYSTQWFIKDFEEVWFQRLRARYSSCFWNKPDIQRRGSELFLHSSGSSLYPVRLHHSHRHHSTLANFSKPRRIDESLGSFIYLGYFSLYFRLGYFLSLF